MPTATAEKNSFVGRTPDRATARRRRERAVALYTGPKKLTTTAIGRKLGVSKEAVRRMLHRAGVTLRPSSWRPGREPEAAPPRS